MSLGWLARGELMAPRTAAVVAGAGCALIGPAAAYALTKNPTDQIILSLFIAASVVVTILILGLRSHDD
ncbi:hypothetical protein [Methylobacterium sp. V23]|uniref:hypothetical protein n=1 Tax=Methylobacterium sp. V23 TaxID=2044878 RepID=UPI0011B020E3|nr:hypothetical protein [Methylobacterium sp. V23]